MRVDLLHVGPYCESHGLKRWHGRKQGAKETSKTPHLYF